MAESRISESWNHTASVLAMLYNVNRVKGSTKDPAAFHPMAKRKKSEGRGFQSKEDFRAAMRRIAGEARKQK